MKDQCLQPTQLFRKCRQRQDWSLVPVPGLSQKINCSLVDGFIKEMRSKQNKVDAETAVKGALLLKSAAVIGEVFGSRVLQHINPLRGETHKGLLHVLRILEARDFIEVLDETDHKNVVCRFRKIFLRETIYQGMLYRAQKKGLHQLMVQFIQSHPGALDADPDQEAEKLLGHILVAEDLDSEDKVPSKAKQGLVVKKAANKLLRNPNVVVKSGFLTKMGDKPNKKVEKRLLVLTAKEIAWFHNEKEFRANKPLGVIYMSAVYHCVPANTAKRTEDFIVSTVLNLRQIGTCAWRKKQAEKEGKREFIFGAKDEAERDEWITCIEYLRVKATYDNFTQKFCSIALPVRRQSEDLEREPRKGDLLGNLTEFGAKLRASARVAAKDEQPQAAARRQSRSSGRYSRIQNKVGSFAAYNLMNESSTLGGNPKDLAAKLRKLYNIAAVTFVHQVGANACKHPGYKSDSLRKLPEALSSLASAAVDESDLHSSVTVRPSNASMVLRESSASPQPGKADKLFNYKDARRISDIPFRRVLEDSHVEKHFVDEIKSADKGAFKNSD